MGEVMPQLETSPLCSARHPDGWLCILLKGHEGSHLSLDNTRLWKGTPGSPILWALDQALQPTIASMPEVVHMVPRVVLNENKPVFTGRPCPQCQSLNTVQNGKCLLCMECHATGECG